MSSDSCITVTLYDVDGRRPTPEFNFRTFTPFREPLEIKWDDPPVDVEYRTVDHPIGVLTNQLMDPRNGPAIRELNHEYKIAWLLECRSVNEDSYVGIPKMEELFDYIITFDEELLSRDSIKYIKWVGPGSTLVLDEHAKIYKKSKLVSLIASPKKELPGHRLRHEVAHALAEKYSIDLWGRAYKQMPDTYKVMGLAQYAFSIAIENTIYKDYFTEKLIDCFRTGTVPLYWGPRSTVEKYFDMDGIIVFETVEELDHILSNLSMDDYLSRLPSVKANYEASKEWVSMDDRFARLLKTLPCGKENSWTNFK